MRLLAVQHEEEVAIVALQIVSGMLRRNPRAVISLTTGRTTAGLYRALATSCRRGDLDFSAARLVSGEEYLGVAPGDPISLYGWLCQGVLQPCGVDEGSVLRLAGDSPFPHEACRAFDAQLERLGGLDLVIQSIGTNGHFGFNEPGCSREAVSRVVALAPSTRQSNANYWPPGARVPEFALTMGVRSTLRARHVLLLATGSSKAAALARCLDGPIDEEAPCSLLRLAPRLTVVADRDALAGRRHHAPYSPLGQLPPVAEGHRAHEHPVPRRQPSRAADA